VHMHACAKTPPPFRNTLKSVRVNDQSVHLESMLEFPSFLIGMYIITYKLNIIIFSEVGFVF
jgi:hypothetical protein